MLCAAVLVAPVAGTAEEISNVPRIFRQRCQRGQRLLRGQRFDEAVREFQAAYEIKKAPRVLLQLGEALGRSGQIEQALWTYDRYLRHQPGLQARQKKSVEAAMLRAVRSTLARDKDRRGAPGPTPAAAQTGASFAPATRPSAPPRTSAR